MPKANNLKREFCKLLVGIRDAPQALCADQEGSREYCPSHYVSLSTADGPDMRTGPCSLWGRCAKFELNCPICKHAAMMPLRLPDEINANDACLHATAVANGGNGKFNATENKVGCSCYGQNCYGDEHGIRC